MCSYACSVKVSLVLCFHLLRGLTDCVFSVEAFKLKCVHMARSHSFVFVRPSVQRSAALRFFVFLSCLSRIFRDHNLNELTIASFHISPIHHSTLCVLNYIQHHQVNYKQINSSVPQACCMSSPYFFSRCI
jgi:hypothetical protein